MNTDIAGSAAEFCAIGPQVFGFEGKTVSSLAIKHAARLMESGSSIPFIARYQQDLVPGFSPEKLLSLARARKRYDAMVSKRKTALATLERAGVLDEKLRQTIKAAVSEEEVTAITAEFRKDMQRDEGKQAAAKFVALADFVWEQECGKVHIDDKVWMDKLKEMAVTKGEAEEVVPSMLAGRIANDVAVRGSIQEMFWKSGTIECKVKASAPKELCEKYKPYLDYSKRLIHIPPHAILASNRASNEKCISISFSIPFDGPHAVTRQAGWSKLPKGKVSWVLRLAAKEAWTKRIRPAIVRSVKKRLVAFAQEKSIEVFSSNLLGLLLCKPFKTNSNILGIDPGFKNGCKWAVLSPNGSPLEVGSFKLQPHAESERLLRDLVRKHQIGTVAIGNGCGSRDTELLVAKVVPYFPDQLLYCIVPETGSSIYSISPIAREEFPEMNPIHISAISIARRLQNSLSELVKYDPSSLGVGMYQKDIPEKILKEALESVFQSSVSLCGVDVNSASVHLLKYVAGLGVSRARAIVSFVAENGPLDSRDQLKNIPGIGPKTFQEAAGFLMVFDGSEPFDETIIHPDDYSVAKSLISSFFPDVSVREVLRDRDRLKCVLFDAETSGDPSVERCRQLLVGQWDLREANAGITFRSNPLTAESLQPGLRVHGVVANRVDFGFFIDIGFETEGLLHNSEIPPGFPEWTPGDSIEVAVKNYDQKGKRLNLTVVPLEGSDDDSIHEVHTEATQSPIRLDRSDKGHPRQPRGNKRSHRQFSSRSTDVKRRSSGTKRKRVAR